MKLVRIRTHEYYNHPEFYAFMPRSVFDALEASELEGSINGGDIFANVPEEDFIFFQSELTKYRIYLTNGC